MVVSQALAHPRTGKLISVSVAIALRACVRASEAARARDDDSYVARGGRTNLWVSAVRRPSGRGPDKKFEQ